jgi:hypothetical protein
MSAYDNRGRAHSKGDYTHAVEDVTKAHELMAKATAQPIMVTPKANVSASNIEEGKIPEEGGHKAINNVAKKHPAAAGGHGSIRSNGTNQLGKKAKPDAVSRGRTLDSPSAVQVKVASGAWRRTGIDPRAADRGPCPEPRSASFFRDLSTQPAKRRRAEPWRGPTPLAHNWTG